MAGCVDDLERGPAGLERLPILERHVRAPGDVDLVPEHAVVVVEADGHPSDEAVDVEGGVDVVVVPVGADDGHHGAVVDGLDDRAGLVGGVDDEDLAVVADQPDVVLDVEALPVEGELAAGDDPVDPDVTTSGGRHQRTTTERRTSPRSILWNASSTWSMPIVSDTNPSRSS